MAAPTRGAAENYGPQPSKHRLFVVFPVLFQHHVKAAKYADQDNFSPFVLETGACVNKAARDAPEQANRCSPSQDDYAEEPVRRAHGH
jgi:hypothetical protein